MGATYTRQSSYTDGDVITAAHTNDEFNQLLAAFQASTGHTHDGTANEGGPITKLLGNTLTFGAGTAGTDITITFDGETSDGVLKWMEDEDYFEFSDDILVASTEKLQFRDTAIYINSSTDGQLDLVADTEIQLAATTVDLNGNLDVSGSLTLGGTAITSTAAELNILDGVTSTAAELNILDGVTSTTAELNILDGVTSTTAELNILDGVTSTTAELNILDGVTSTATELNIMDGDTSASSTTLADADRVVVNDAGTMKQVALTDFETYFESALDTLSNVTTVGALNSGSITSGFGAIDNGSSAITTTGTITYGSLSDGSITITAFVDEDNMASNSATLVPTQQSVKAYVDTQITAEDLDFQADSGGALSIDLDSETLTFTGGTGIDTSGSGNAVTFAIDSTVATLSGTQTLTNKTLTSPKVNEDVAVTATATEINILDGVTSTTAELNILDGVTSTTAELNILDGVTSTTAELNILDGVTSTAAELNILDTATVTAGELNLLDGDTSVGSSITVADSDGIIVNDGGTMKTIPASAVKTYATAGATSGTVTSVATGNGLTGGTITSSGTLSLKNSFLASNGTVSTGTASSFTASTYPHFISGRSTSTGSFDYTVTEADGSTHTLTMRDGDSGTFDSFATVLPVGSSISGTTFSYLAVALVPGCP